MNAAAHNPKRLTRMAKMNMQETTPPRRRPSRLRKLAIVLGIVAGNFLFWALVVFVVGMVVR